jgi:hypothetical protein
MALDLGDLISAVKPDPWRAEVGFSEDIVATNERLFGASSDEAARSAIREWISRYQPCLFGRMAAKTDLISFCILTEADLCGDRTALRDKIQGAREEWLALGYDGRKSAFIILLISPRIACAVPDGSVQAIARELCASYLLREIAPDEIYLDEMFLEKPGTRRTVWKWLAGVNYFCAQGDCRWWHDHRIPGGMAFSVNSVGHLVKSGQLSEAMKHFDEVMGGPGQSLENEAVTSLGKALDLAMRTINLAAHAPSGKATTLVPLPSPLPNSLPACPTTLPKVLEGKNYTAYQGWYHTDVTVPSEYFRPDVQRPIDIVAKELDFTYLFHDDIENPDHITTAKGRRVRSHTDVEKDSRLLRMVAETAALKDQPILQNALGRRKRD